MSRAKRDPRTRYHSLEGCASPKNMISVIRSGLLFRRREEGCQGSRCGRLAQPLTTLFPERSSRPDRMTDRSALACALGCRPVWVREEIPSLPRFHSHSRGVLGLGLGARWCPGRSGAAIYQTVSSGVALPPRPSHESQSPGQGLGRILAGLLSGHTQGHKFLWLFSPFGVAASDP